jgi:hypothetical protein
MADKPTPTHQGEMRIAMDGAIPRMGMNIPMPASTKPPAPSSQQSSDKPQGPK